MSFTTGYTDDVLEYIRISVPKTMLADLKDSVRNGRSLNVQDKYGTSAVSIRSYTGEGHFETSHCVPS